MAETDTNTSTGPDYCPTIEQEIDYRWSLGYAVGEDGTAWPMLIDHEYRGERSIPTAHGWREVAPHEGTGLLPTAYLVTPCAATTGKGTRCKFRPQRGMPYCGHHEHQDELLAALRGAECVSEIRRLWADNAEAMNRWPAYVAAYKARGKQLEAEGALW